MRTVLILAVIVFSGPLVAQEKLDPAQTYSACAGCHGHPDSRIGGDDLWIGRIATTACVQPPGPKGLPLRDALIAFLREGEWDRPVTETAERAASDGEGTVRLGFGDASVLLVPLSDHVSAPMRLVWSDRETKGAARTIRAGRYRIQGYRIGLSDAAGVRWEIWGSGAKGREIVVPAGGEIELSIDRRVRVEANARPNRGKFNIGVQVLGDHKMGVTVVREQERVPANYVIENETSEVSAGTLGYG